MERKEENGEQKNEDQNGQDAEVYLPFLVDLVAKLTKADPVKNATRITSLSSVVKALRGDGVSQTLLASARTFVRQLHTAVNATVSDDVVLTSGSCREQLSRPNASAATNDQKAEENLACSQTSGNGDAAIDSEQQTSTSGVCAEVENEITASAATGDESATSISEASDPGACADGIESDQSKELNKKVDNVEPSNEDVATEDSANNVREQQSCIAAVKESGSRARRNSNGTECSTRNDHAAEKDLAGIDVATNVGSAQERPSEMNTWSTPEKIDIISSSSKDDGSENQFILSNSPNTRDCPTSPKESDASETPKPNRRNRAKFPTQEFMEWKFIPIDGIRTKQASASRQSATANLDPRCNGSSNKSDETPKALPETNDTPNPVPQPNFDVTSLTSLVDWLKERNERGERVPIPLNVTIPVSTSNNSNAVPIESKEPAARSCGEQTPKGDTKQSDDDCVFTGFYRDARPFHLLHNDAEPVIPPEFLPILLKTEGGSDAKSSGQLLQGPSSFPLGCHAFPRPGIAGGNDPTTANMGEERVSTGPRIARRKIHDRYDEIVDDWAQRGEKGKIEEIENRRLKDQLERERSEKERLERQLQRENERKEQERARQQQQQQEMNAARMNHNFATPHAQHNGSTHHFGANQQPLPCHCCNLHAPNQYPCQHVPLPYMPATHHVRFPNPPHGPATNPMVPMYPNPHGPMMIHHTPFLPMPNIGPLSMPLPAFLPTLRPPLLPLNPHAPAAAPFTNPHGPTPNNNNHHHHHHQAAGGVLPTVADRNGLGIPRQNGNCQRSDCSQPLSSSTGLLSYCKHCEYIGNNFELVAHYVNVHSDSLLPVQLSQSELKEAQKELCSDTSLPTRRETGIRCLDDLSWIPTGSVFMDEQTCKLCPYKGKIRSTFIQHVQKHREEKLSKMPKPTPPLAVFNCRFCDDTFTEINVFYNHITGHTGEFAFKCSKCKYRGQTKIIMKVHNSQDHPRIDAAVLPTDNRRVLDGSVLGGYGCSLCGFVQLNAKNVESHVAREHLKGNAKILKINMSRSNNNPRPSPLERRPSTSNKALSSDPRSSAKAIAVPRRGPPVKVKGDPRTAMDRATVKDLAMPPSRPHKVAHSSSQLNSSRSPKQLVSKPNSNPKALRPDAGASNNLKSYSIPKKSVPKPPSDKSSTSAPTRLAGGTSLNQLEADNGITLGGIVVPLVTSMAQAGLMPPPKEAVIVQDTSQFASNIIIKSDGEAVGCLTMELEIGEVTNPNPIDEDAETEAEPKSGFGVAVKWEKDDGLQEEGDDSDDTVEMNFDSAPCRDDVIGPPPSLDDVASNQVEVAAPPNRAEVAAPPNRAEVAAPPNRVEVAAPPNRVEVAAPPNRVEVAAPPNRVEVAAPPNRVEVAAPPNRVEVAAPPNRVEVAAPPNRVDVAAPPNRVDVAAPPNRVDAAAPPNRVDAAAPPSPNRDDVVPLSNCDVFSAPPGRVIKTERLSFDETGPVPSIADTILKLQVQLHQEPSSDSAPSVTPPAPDISAEAAPVFYTNSCSQRIRISSRRLRDWNERRKVLICGCLFAARSTEAFTKHREHWHKGEKRAACPECNSKFDLAADYADHLWRTCPRSSMRMYACSVEPLCRFTTSSQLHFITHVKEEHAGIEWLPCYWCGKQYTTGDCLAAHLHNQCTIKIPMLKALQSNAASVSASRAAAEDRGETCSPEEPAAPHLEVVYRCYDVGCQHESLEREVFIDHIQVDHPERKEHGCFHCEDRFGSIYSLVLHVEEKHRERDSNGHAAVADRALSPATRSSRESPDQCNPVATDSGPIEIVSNVANSCISSQPCEQNNVSAVIPVPARIVIPVIIPTTESASIPSREEAPIGYMWSTSKRMQVNELLRMLSLSYEIISTAKLDPTQLVENLTKWLEIHGPQKGRTLLAMKRCVDPLVFAAERKSEAAMRAILDDREKLAHMYKCAAKLCTFTSSDENEFREHLLLDKCRTDHWLYCLYCGERHKTVRGAVSHVSQRHMLCIHQCPHCIYRTKNKGYLMFHMARFHPQDDEPMVKLMICPAPRPVDLEDELPDLFSLSVPVACAVDGCTFVTLDPLPLINHHRNIHHDLPVMPCFHCMESFAPNEVERHFQQHQIFNIQCRYCSYGTCVPAEIIVHLCSIHPNRTGRVVLRECSQPPVAPAATVVQGSYSTTQSQSQVRIKREPGEHHENEHPAVSASSAAGDSVLPSTSRDPPTVREVAVAAAILSTSSPPALPTDSVAAPGEPNRHSCGYQPCRYSTNRLRELDDHLTECSRRYVGDLLYCKQCYSTFRDPTSFLEHLRSHLAKVFICGLCNHMAQLPHYMKSHLRSAHNLAFEDTKCKLSFPDSDSLSETAEYIYEPVVPKLVIRQDPTGNAGLTSEVASTSAAAKSSVPEDLEVDDVDSIPTQSIFVRPLKCRHCNYSNKVRQNLIRHIEQCKRDRAACRTAPEVDSSGETSADAAFSSSCSSAATPSDNANPSLRIWHPRQLPKYVNAKERFRCCIGDCTRLEITSAAYEAHLTGAHADVLQLPCPHCGDEFADISDFHLHIQLHGPNLFRCWYCTYHHYHRNLITGHCLDQHPGVPPLVRTLRQEHEIDVPDNSLVSNWRRSREESAVGRAMTGAAAATLDVAVAGPSCGGSNEDHEVPRQLAFVCGTCKKFKTSSESSMRAHLVEELELETYACSRCAHTCNTNAGIQEHFRSAHDGEIPDFRVGMDHRHEVLLSQLLESQAENLRTLDRQLSMAGGGGNNNSNGNDARPSASVYPCPKCTFVHPARSFARMHILSHLQMQNNKCKKCDAQFSRLQHLRRHHLTIHPDQPFVGHKSKDLQIEAFVDWVLKRLEDAAYGDSDIPRPITITCQKNGCLMPFSDLKKFNEHFKKHVRSGPMGPRACATASLAPRTDDVTPGTSANSNFVEDQTDDSDNPKGARFELRCPYCNFKHPVKANVRRHILRHYDFKFYLCGYCAHEGLEHKDVVYHCRNNHASQPEAVIEKPRPEILELRPVGARELMVVNLEQLGGSCPTQRNGKYQCSECLFATTGLAYARYHCQNRHLKASVLKVWRGDPAAAPDNQLPAAEDEATPTVGGDGGEQSQECTMCHERLMGPKAYLDHIMEKHSAGSCSGVSRKAKRKKSQLQPVAKRQPNATGSKAVGGAPTDVVAYRCKACLKQFREMTELRTHYRVFHPTEELAHEDVLREEMYRCPKCSFASAFYEEAKRHLLRYHVEPYLCGLCGKPMWSHDGVIRHSRAKHKQEPAVVEKNPGYKEQRLSLMRQLKQSPRKRRQEGCDVAAPPQQNEGEDDDEVTVIEIGDDVVTEVAISLQPVGSDASFTPETADHVVPAASPGGETSQEPECAEQDSPYSPAEQESPASPVPSCSGGTVPPSTPSRAVAKKSTASPMEELGAKKRGKKRKTWEGEAAVWNCKRISLADQYPNGFSYYGFRPENVDFSRLSVYTNFRGMQNAKMDGAHLCEVFPMFPKVMVTDCCGHRPKRTAAATTPATAEGGGGNSGESPE